MIQDTQRLENLRAEAGRLTRTQLATLGDLARQQGALRDETAQLAEKLELTEVINLALDGAAGHMGRAAELLEKRETGACAQGAQEAARRRLAQLLEAFKNGKKPGGKQGGSGGGGGGGSGGSRPDGAMVLTQLKLLKLMQEDLNDRYRNLVADGDKDRGELRSEMAEMAEQQGKLAELTLKLSEPAANNPEDNPDKLPDVRDELDPGAAEPLLPGAEAPAEVPPSDLLVEPPDRVPPGQ